MSSFIFENFCHPISHSLKKLKIFDPNSQKNGKKKNKTKKSYHEPLKPPIHQHTTATFHRQPHQYFTSQPPCLSAYPTNYISLKSRQNHTTRSKNRRLLYTYPHLANYHSHIGNQPSHQEPPPTAIAHFNNHPYH